MNIQQMMQQAKQMQNRMQDMQAELGKIEVTGQSGGGLVSVVMTCKGDVRSVKIAPDLINPSDAETLEDMVAAAVNAARIKADETMSGATRDMMKDFGLPSDFELPKF